MRRIYLAATLVWLLICALSMPARADNIGLSVGGGTSVNFQDDNLISYQFDLNLSSQMRSASSWTLVNSYATTDLNVLRVGDGHGQDWNNHYAIGPMPDPSFIGFHNCIYWIGPEQCWHAHIRYKNASLSSTTYERALACHETGHSVGLRHSGPTANSRSIVHCMWNPVPSGDPYVGPHNVAHINGHY